MLRGILLNVLVTITNLVNAQSATIVGKVSSQDSAVNFANIILKGTPLGCISDSAAARSETISSPGARPHQAAWS